MSQQVAHLRRPLMSALRPLSGAKRKTGPFRFRPRCRTTATNILPSLNVETARSWRGIVSFTHLAREGRMTVTIGRRELLAALGGAAVLAPLAASAQEPGRIYRLGVLIPSSRDAPAVTAFFDELRHNGFVEG